MKKMSNRDYVEEFCDYHGYDIEKIEEELWDRFLDAINRPGCWEREPMYNLLGLINLPEDWEQYEK
jgi:hypothetical protein